MTENIFKGTLGARPRIIGATVYALNRTHGLAPARPQGSDETVTEVLNDYSGLIRTDAGNVYSNGEFGIRCFPDLPATMTDVGAADDIQAQADALRELERVTRDYAARPEKIEAARALGAKWSDIASSLGMSVTAARKLHSKFSRE